MSRASSKHPSKVYLCQQTDTALVTKYSSSIDQFRLHNRGGHAVLCETPDDAELIVLFEEWQTRFADYADTFNADPFCQKHWRKIYTVNCDDLGRGFLPGCYTSLNLRTYDARLHRACAYPYEYNELAHRGTSRFETEYLFGFRGTDASHPIRRSLFRLHESNPRGKMVLVRTSFHSHDVAQKQAYIDDILSSAFALCPRGWSPASYRMFEVMALGRCPVVISDDWVPIEGPRWEECSIRIKESEIGRLPAILTEREADAQRLGHAARKTWEANFSVQAKFQTILRKLIELHGQRSDTDYRLRWATREFRRANGWLLSQRALRKAREYCDKWAAEK